MTQPIIIANIIGGLGNQMFQYANARALALDLQLQFKVTQDMFGAYTNHNGPELERVFSLTLNSASADELRDMIGALRVTPVVRSALYTKLFSPLRGKRYIAEPHFGYWNALRDHTRTGGYLQGYWQSERYFVEHSATIRIPFRTAFFTPRYAFSFSRLR